MPQHHLKKPSLFAAIAIGIGCIIGSGWLFAAYYASHYAGPISLLSWVIGAALALILALLLAEICTLYPKERGLFSRLISLSHNRDYGFVVAISNWLGVVVTIPSEAEATVQYLSSANPSWQPHLFVHAHLTSLGIAIVCGLMVIYGLINFWGIRSLTKINNYITLFKILVPTITGILILVTAFHAGNFTAYHHTIAPYGVGNAFTAIVVSGIFYAFYGFGMIAVFGSELKNPKRNIPIALCSSIAICLVIYLILQVAFIGAIPPHLLANGWHHLNFDSPLAQLLILLNLNFWAVILYIDSAVSPSGTAMVYTGSAARMLTGMAQDQQVPRFFNKLHPVYHLSRRSLLFTLLFCFVMVLFFRNWQKIMILVTVFQLITVLAIPVAFTKFRNSEGHRERKFSMPGGKILSPLIFLLISYLLTQAGTEALMLSTILHAVLFFIYSFGFYQRNVHRLIQAFLSAWGIFAYLVFTTIFGYLNDIGLLSRPAILTVFLLGSLGFYWILVKQKNAHNG